MPLSKNHLKKIIKSQTNKINRKDEYGWTPLLRACYDSDTDCRCRRKRIYDLKHDNREIRNNEIIRYLVKSGVEINITNNDGWIPLLYTCKSNNEEIFKYFVQNGADINVKNDNGWNHLMYVYNNNNKDIVKYLIEKWNRPQY